MSQPKSRLNEVSAPALAELADHSRTDKNTTHSYLPLYDQLLSLRRETAKNVLEIGVQDGGSIKMWHDYFPQAQVYGVDIMEKSKIWSDLRQDRITLYTQSDAYAQHFIENILGNKRYDVIVDDGPHTLASMLVVMTEYSRLLADDGILIIEDVQDLSWVDVLMTFVPSHLKPVTTYYDLRGNKGRYDDILVIVDKRGLTGPSKVNDVITSSHDVSDTSTTSVADFSTIIIYGDVVFENTV